MRTYSHAQTWNDIHVAVVHGMDMLGSIPPCSQLIEKYTGFWTNHANVMSTGWCETTDVKSNRDLYPLSQAPVDK